MSKESNRERSFASDDQLPSEARFDKLALGLRLIFFVSEVF